jgi:hypothetical protein
MLGTRLSRLQQSTATLYRQLSAGELLRLQEQIQEEAGTIEKLQMAAEKAFFLILFPYYFSEIMVDLADKAKIPQRFPNLERVIGINKTIIFASVGLGITFAFFRPLMRYFDITSMRVKLLIGAILLAVVAGLTVLAALMTPS